MSAAVAPVTDPDPVDRVDPADVRGRRGPLLVAAVIVALAVAADVLLLGVQRAVTPWQRGVR